MSDKYNKVMRISDKAIQELKSNLNLRNRLAYELKKSPRTIDRWIEENVYNNDLTKELAVKIIEEESGLSRSEILEECVTEAAQK